MAEQLKSSGTVCALVLNWNQPTLTLECLESLLPDILAGKLRLVVCDNHSADESVEQISQWMEDNIRALVLSEKESKNFALSDDIQGVLICSEHNYGYAGGNNIGLNFLAAQKAVCDYVWLLNNDTRVGSNALDKMLAFAEQFPQKALIGPTVVEASDPDTVQYAGGAGYNPLLSIISNPYKGRSVEQLMSEQAEPDLAYVSGSAMFCRFEVLKQVGYLDERFFLYFEELDLTQRVKKLGYHLGWCKDSIVSHHRGMSTGGHSHNKSKGSWMSHYHENLSCLWLTLKHYPFYLPIVMPFRLISKMVLFTKRMDFHLFSALFAAYKDFLLNKTS